MDKNLPRHLRGIGYDNRPWPDRGSPYYNGHYAQRHPNAYYEDERTVEVVQAMLYTATEALRGKGGAVLSLHSAAALKAAFEALDHIENHLPRIQAWCCWTTDKWSTNEHVWSGHFTEKEARVYVKRWKHALAHRDDYTWYVSLHACDITDLVDPAATRVIFGSYDLSKEGEKR